MTLACEELEHLGWFHFPRQSAQTQIPTFVILAGFVFFDKGIGGKVWKRLFLLDFCYWQGNGQKSLFDLK